MQIDLPLLTLLVSSPSPSSLITPLVLAEIRRFDSYFDDHERQLELMILSTYYSDLLALGKDQLQLTLPNLTTLFSLGHSLIHFESFSRAEIKEKDYKEELTTDILAFRQRLRGVEGLTRVELQAVTEYVFRTYFQHYRLYHYLYSGKQASETKLLEITVETPLPSESLGAAVQRLEFRDIAKSPDKYFSRSNSISSRTNSRRPSTRLSDHNFPSEARKNGKAATARLPPEPTPPPNEVEVAIAAAEAEFSQMLKARQEVLDRQVEEARKKLRR
jgi:hypothetical protein